MSLTKSILVVAVVCTSASATLILGESAHAGKVVRFRSQASRRTTGQVDVDTQAASRRVTPVSHQTHVVTTVDASDAPPPFSNRTEHKPARGALTQPDAHLPVTQTSKPPWYSARRWMLSIPPIRRRIEGQPDAPTAPSSPIRQVQAYSFASDPVPPAPLSEQGEPPIPAAAQPGGPPQQVESQWPATGDVEWYPQADTARYPIVDGYRYPIEDERSHAHRVSQHMFNSTYDMRLCHQEKCQRLHGDSYYDPIGPHHQPAYGHHQTCWRRFPEQCLQCSPAIVPDPVIGQEPAVKQRIVHVTVHPRPPKLPPLPDMGAESPALQFTGPWNPVDQPARTARANPESAGAGLEHVVPDRTPAPVPFERMPERPVHRDESGPEFEVPLPEPSVQSVRPSSDGPVAADREMMQIELVRPIGDNWDVECFADDWDDLESCESPIRGVSAEVPEKRPRSNVEASASRNVRNVNRNADLVGPDWETGEKDYELEDDNWSDFKLPPLP